MIVAVIGLGSMGRRRIRLLKQLDSTLKILGIDIEPNRCTMAVQEFDIEVFNDLDTVFRQYQLDCAFVCCSPLSHHKIIWECLNKGLHVFTELNLILDGYEKNIELARKKNVTLFLSSTFLYREEIKYIIKKVKNIKGLLNYSYHVGQYLPDWHPWENFQNFFVNDARTNGCREIFAIELPWLIHTFGNIIDIKVIKNKITSLNIPYMDSYHLLVEHSSGTHGTLCVDVVSRKPVRKLEVYGENLYLYWEGNPDELYEYDIQSKTDKKIELYEEVQHVEGYSKQIVENAYYKELQSFFNVIAGKEKAIYTFEEDRNTLKIIDLIEGMD